MPELIAAATVVLARDAAGGPELLMVRRDTRLAFAGGAWVFPGGRIDPGDFAGDPDDLAGAEVRAAAREAEEETGLRVEAARLVRWSHWTPPDHGQAHRFSTAFFVAAAPPGTVVVDQVEIRDHRWTTAADALAAHGRGEVELTPPTFITLTQLATSATVTDLLRRGREEPTEHFHTRIAADGDHLVALYHGDAGYGDGDPGRAGGRHRLVMAPDGWRYLRDPDA